MGPPQRLAVMLRDRLRLRLFIETGTFKGETSAWAATRFERVVTIEAAAILAEAARKRFAGTNVRVIEGNSATALGELLGAESAPAMFWLDAHWCGGSSAGVASECPLMDEIAAINRRGRDDVILVDDARLFLAPPPAPHDAGQWPTLPQVMRVLEADGRRFVAAIDDSLVAIPSAEREFFTRAWQAELSRRASRSLWVARMARLLGVRW